MPFRTVVAIVVTLFTVFVAAQADESLLAPSLLTPQDIPAKNGSIAERIRSSYAFVADFHVFDKGAAPKGWLRPKSDPFRGVLLGMPTSFPRPDPELETTEYALGVINYFQGEDALLPDVNAVVTFWSHGDYQRAYNLLMDLKNRTNNMPPSNITALVAKLLRAQFHLFLAVNKDIIVKTELGTPIPFGMHHHYAQGILWETLSHFDFARIATPVDTHIDREIYDSFWQHPFILRNDILSFGKSFPVKLLQRSVDPLLWVRSVALQCYWNTAVGLREFHAWGPYFNIAEKFEQIAERLSPSLPKAEPSVTLIKEKRPLVMSKIRFWPKNYRDLLGTLKLARSITELVNEDPQQILYESDAAIRASVSNDVAALAFYLSSNIFYDFNNFRYARQLYAWSEGIAPHFAESVPVVVLLGAEASFWHGDFEIARKGFEKFTLLSGDSSYGPWARMRLAEISQIQGKMEPAIERYEEITRLFPEHTVAKDATVRLFCVHAPSLPPNALAKAYDEVQKVIENASDALKSQAKACLLKEDLKDLADDSSNKPSDAVVDAKKQLDAIDDYKNEFPDSDYLGLFTDRIQKLELSEALFQAAEAHCKDFIKFYKDHRSHIKKIKPKDADILKSLTWGKAERITLLRCSALTHDNQIATEMQKSDAKDDAPKLHPLFFKLQHRPSDSGAVALFHALSTSDAKDWKKVITQTEKSGDTLIRDKDFWRKISTRALIEFELGTPQKDKKNFRKTVVTKVLEKPELVLQSEILCDWTLAASHNFSSGQWDHLSKATSGEEWLAMLEKGKTQLQCPTRLAKKLFAVSLVEPSSLRDTHLLRKYLESKGVAEAEEQWLSYAERMANSHGPLDQNTREIFAKIYKEAKSQIIKASAKAWIEKNVDPNTSLL